jgi:NADP-dependent 3-hydroxy acid dehydrogenase YdfG
VAAASAAVARTCAREGATVFLAGRRAATLDEAAAEVAAAGGTAHTAVVDALDEAAVDRHLAEVVERVGSVDVSFNLTTRGDVQGSPSSTSPPTAWCDPSSPA